jgi:cell division protein FtsL
MINRRKNNYFEKIFFNQKSLAFLGLIVIILISFPFAKNTLKQYRVNKEISELKQEISDLQNKNNGLKDLVSYWGSDQFAEEQARSSLDLIKPGEKKIVIIPATGDTLASTSSSTTMFNITGYEKAKPEVKQSNPKKWLNYFLK